MDSETRTHPFAIGPARIGPGNPVYVIAEIGVNHDGDVSAAQELIRAAAEAGADAVKFQVFAADRLVTRDAPATGYQRNAAGAASQHDLLRRLELSHETFADLMAFAGHCDVEFLATPFSVHDLTFLADLGVRALKLASPDIINRPLVESAVATGLPVIASTGAADIDEIAEAVALFDRPAAGPLALLHCISAYPADASEANLRAITTLARVFGRVTGFSDHTGSLIIGGYAVAAGAGIIEKHLTLDRHRPGPDHGFSLEPDQMADYIRNIRAAESMLGDGNPGPTPSQREIRDLARGSVVAARDIPAGHPIHHEMLTVKRPGGGITPAQLDRLVGRVTRVAVRRDTPLTWEMVEAVAVDTSAPVHSVP